MTVQAKDLEPYVVPKPRPSEPHATNEPRKTTPHTIKEPQETTPRTIKEAPKTIQELAPPRCLKIDDKAAVASTNKLHYNLRR